jgi:hypothetical protein
MTNLIVRPECYIFLTDHPKLKIPWFIPFSKIQVKINQSLKFAQILGEILPERYSYSIAVVNVLNWAIQPHTILSYFTLHMQDDWSIKFELLPHRIQHLGFGGGRNEIVPQIGLVGRNTNVTEDFTNGYVSENILIQVE